MHENCTNNFYHVEQDSECDAYFANNSFFFPDSPFYLQEMQWHELIEA